MMAPNVGQNFSNAPSTAKDPGEFTRLVAYLSDVTGQVERLSEQLVEIGVALGVAPEPAPPPGLTEAVAGGMPVLTALGILQRRLQQAASDGVRAADRLHALL